MKASDDDVKEHNVYHYETVTTLLRMNKIPESSRMARQANYLTNAEVSVVSQSVRLFAEWRTERNRHVTLTPVKRR